MTTLRTVLWRATAAGTLLFAAGFTAAAAIAFVYGDWYQAREPWIGIVLSLLVFGLLVADIAGTAWVVAAGPLWAKFVVLLPAAAAAFWWGVMLVIGVGTTGLGGAEHDVRTILYSAPELAAPVVFAAAAILALAVIARFGHSRKPSAGADEGS